MPGPYLGWPSLTLRMGGGVRVDESGSATGARVSGDLGLHVLNLQGYDHMDTGETGNLWALRVGAQLSVDGNVASGPSLPSPTQADGVGVSGGAAIELAVHPAGYRPGIAVHGSVGGGDRGLHLSAGIELGLVDLGTLSALTNLRVGAQYSYTGDGGEHVASLTLAGHFDLTTIPAIFAGLAGAGSR